MEEIKEEMRFIGSFFIFALIATIIVGVAVLPFIRMNYTSRVQKYHIFRDTLDNARIDNFNEIERTAILQDVAKWNMDITSARYWRDTIFRLYIPKSFTELEIIE